MNFELNKKYIVEVTNKGIIPIEEFCEERFFDKDHDELDFLTDEEKEFIIRQTCEDLMQSIKTHRLEAGKYNSVLISNKVEYDEIFDVIDNYLYDRLGADK